MKEQITEENLERFAKRACEYNEIKETAEKIQAIKAHFEKVFSDLNINPSPYATSDLSSDMSQLFNGALWGCISDKDGKIEFNEKKLTDNLKPFQEENKKRGEADKKAHAADLDYRGLKAKGLMPGSAYWLADTDINHALKIDSKTMRSSLTSDKNIYFTGAIPIDSFVQSIQQFKKLKTPSPFTIYCPLNIGDRHWVSLKIEYGSNNKVVATYVDSLFGTEEQQKRKKDELEDLLNSCLKDATEIKVNVAFSGKQQDGWTCGYRTIGEIVKNLNIPDHPIQNAYNDGDVNGLRNSVFAAIGGKVILSDENPSPKIPNSKWTKFATEKVKPIFDKIFGGESKTANGKITTKYKNCNIEYSEGQVCAIGEPDNEALDKMLQSMIEIKMSSGATTPIAVTVETTPRNSATEGKLAELAKKYSGKLVLKVKKQKEEKSLADNVDRIFPGMPSR